MGKWNTLDNQKREAYIRKTTKKILKEREEKVTEENQPEKEH